MTTIPGGGPASTASSAGEIAVDLFKSIVWDAWTKLAEASLMTSLGIASGGIVAFLFTTVFGLIADSLYNMLVTMTDLATIQLKNAVHESQFNNASEKLSIIATEYGVNSQQYQEAHAEEQTAFYNLIKFNSDPLGVNKS